MRRSGPGEACEDQGCLTSWEYSPREEMEVSFGGGCQSLQSILALSLPTLCHSAASPSDLPPPPILFSYEGISSAWSFRVPLCSRHSLQETGLSSLRTPEGVHGFL